MCSLSHFSYTTAFPHCAPDSSATRVITGVAACVGVERMILLLHLKSKRWFFGSVNKADKQLMCDPDTWGILPAGSCQSSGII